MATCRMEGCENSAGLDGLCNHHWSVAVELGDQERSLGDVADILENQGMTSATVGDLRELARQYLASAKRILGEE